MTLERVDIDDCQDRLQVVLHRNRYDFVLARLPAESQVLEIGTGPGIFSRELIGRCEKYVGVEYDPATCAKARRNTDGQAEIIEADARNLPFAPDEFSFIICLEVIEHLGDFQAGVHNLHRCLRPDGTAIISVPYRRLGGKGRTNEHHPYEPGEHELVSLLRGLFSRVEVYYQYFPETLWMTLARCLHIRRLVGLQQTYADLAAGEPGLTRLFRIDQRPRGLKEGLIVVVSGKKKAPRAP